jgi:hypothetical protein
LIDFTKKSYAVAGHGIVRTWTAARGAWQQRS